MTRQDRVAAVDGTPFVLNSGELWELAFQCAGAATAPLLEDHPHYAFPAERVSGAVGQVLTEAGYGPPPRGYTVDDEEDSP